MDFQTKYAATPFDGNSEFDVNAEAARKFAVGAFINCMKSIKSETPDDIQSLVGGLLVAIVQIQMSMVEESDHDHAILREHMAKVIPWAIDLTRDMQGLPPLTSA